MTSTINDMSLNNNTLYGVKAAPGSTVKMERLCSRSYAVMSGTSGDINMGSSGDCLEWNFILLSLSAKWYADIMSSY